ncbi:MAG: fibronectin type III domain-containing protein [bacterium]|nr:fibronectin type III domain-containing protein [bacterium]
MHPQTKKIPTLLGLLLLVVGIGAGVILTQYRQFFNIGATGTAKPQEVRITNVSSTTFTISWTTKIASFGFLAYGEGKTLNYTASQNKLIGPLSLVHSVDVDDLKPDTTYYFKVGVNKDTYGNKTGDYSVKTSKKFVGREADVVFGTVADGGGKGVTGGIVYLTIPGVQQLSAVTDSKGAWVINLGNALGSSLSSPARYDGEKATLDIYVQAGKGFASARAVTQSAKPLPPIVLGKTHDFTSIPVNTVKDLPQSSLGVSLAVGKETTVPGIQKTVTVSPSPIETQTPVQTPSKGLDGGLTVVATAIILGFSLLLIGVVL